MSVRTTADECLDEAGKAITNAILQLNKVIVEKCWGHDDYNEEYAIKVREIYRDLIELAVKLDR